MSKINKKTTVEIEVKTVNWANGKAQKCQAIARVKDKDGEIIKTFLGDPRGARVKNGAPFIYRGFRGVRVQGGGMVPDFPFHA